MLNVKTVCLCLDFCRIQSHIWEKEFYTALDTHSGLFRNKGGNQGRILDEILQQVNSKVFFYDAIFE